MFLSLQQQCDKYWGDVLSVQKHVQQGDVHIFLDSILELSRLTIRTFHIQKVSNTVDHLSLVVRKPVFGVSDEVRHKPGCLDTEEA